MMTEEEFKQQLSFRMAQIFEQHPELYDHRRQYPWLTGSLGDPFSGIWFVAENPSLSRVELITAQLGDSITEEAQWLVSPGDRLFRDMLVKYGFKDAPWNSRGGWHCYVTDVIKETDYAERWRTKSLDALRKAGETWWPVFKWEFENSRPKLVVIMGEKARDVLTHLATMYGLTLPHAEHIVHYSYIGSRAEGKLGPMHPIRVQKYDESFAKVASTFRVLG